MSRTDRDLYCLACGVLGREGRDVLLRLVEIPAGERREVSVNLPVHHASDSLQLPVTVPERYGYEPRCRDETACRERVLREAAESAPRPAPPSSPVDASGEALAERTGAPTAANDRGRGPDLSVPPPSVGAPPIPPSEAPETSSAPIEEYVL